MSKLINSNVVNGARTGLSEKKISKNKKIMIFSMLGITGLTIGVSLPFGFLTNFNNKTIIVEDIDRPYDETIPLVTNNTDFKAYYVGSWANLFFTQINIDLSKNSSIPANQINLANLAKIGIVPSNENWRNWQWVRSAPILNKNNQFQIIMQTTALQTDVFSYHVLLNAGTQAAIKPSTKYNVNTSYFNNNNFIAYKPNFLTKLSDSYLTYTKTSADINTSINIENLENIGIVPIFDAYKAWEQITLFPINSTTVKVTISLSNNINDTISYNIMGLTASTLYDSTTPLFSSNDNSFIAYAPKYVKENFLVNLSIEYTKSNSNPDFVIDYDNLAKIGILPLSNEYKLWESIKLQPINSNQVKFIVNVTSTKVFEYTVTGVKKSTFYDDTQVIYDTDPNFIMYLPNNWVNIYPVEGTLRLTSTAFNSDERISLTTLEKIGIVPITLEYLNWTSIEITPIKSGTCTVVIKKNNDADTVATIEANYFKSSGTYGNTILRQISNADYNFIWYRPTAWNNTISASTITLDYNNASQITLESLERIGIVPLNDSYKSWTSIARNTVLHNLQGLFDVTITHALAGVSPQVVRVSGFKTSSIYDPFTVLEQTADYIRFLPVQFKALTLAIISSKYQIIDWSGASINTTNLETLGIVPLNDNYRNWRRLYYLRYQGPTQTITKDSLVFSVLKTSDNLQDGEELVYPIDIVI